MQAGILGGQLLGARFRASGHRLGEVEKVTF